jgi:tetratricopeptide (TPR) repeat protein
MTETHSRKHFFISYTSADRPWAEWIAWQLEQEGYTTLIQAWDFAPGSNFVLEMDTAARTAERTIAVLSPAYVQSGFTPSEWAAAFAHDPKGEQRLLVPVRIRPFNAEGLLRQVVYIDLVGRDEQEARTVLLAGVRHERAKPLTSPAFPAVAQTQAERPAFPGALPSLWNVPYRRNPYFTGREDLLTRLHELLHSGKATALTQPQAISGLGGIGKTQTAVEYAYRSRGDYQAVLWASAAARETLISDFVALAALLQLPERDVADQGIVVAAVKRWLASNKDWLLILDNADDLELAAEFMPLASSGHILLTTRAQFTGAIANSLEVEKMEQAEGALLLLRRAKLLAQDAPLEQATAHDRSLAEAVVRELDGLPLALDQAGAYIEETNCGLSGYLDLYRTRRKDLLQRRSKLRSEHPEPVGTTWSLSFQKVEQANPAAAELLRLCAFLDPEAIPEDIITEGAAEAGPLLQAVAADPFQLNEAIEVLRTYSLIKRNAETKTLNMHRLVQVVLRDGMNNEKQREWAQRTVKAVNAAFPEVEYSTWPRCQACLPHALACAVLIEQNKLTFPEAARLLGQVGWYLRDHALYVQAEALLQQALVICEHAPDPEDTDIGSILSNLVLLYQAQAKYAQALPYGQRALNFSEETRGPDHPETAIALDNLASLYSDQGKYEQAEELYQRDLAISEQALGPDHPDTGVTLNNLAVLYSDQGKYEQAEPLYKRSLAIYEQALDPNHPETAITLNNLANLYYAQGKYEQAEPLYQRALAIREKVLDPDHPYIADTLEHYARLLRQMQRNEEAERLEQRARAIRARRSS